jgi:hypothetical protein
VNLQEILHPAPSPAPAQMLYSPVFSVGPGAWRRGVPSCATRKETLPLTALLRKSDSFRSPKSRKLDPGNSLSAGKGSKTASIAAGFGDPLRLGFPHSRAAASPARSSCLSAGGRAGGRSWASPGGGAGGGGAAPGRGRRGLRARSRLASGAPGAPWAFSRLLLLFLPGRSWLPWGARGWR